MWRLIYFASLLFIAAFCFAQSITPTDSSNEGNVYTNFYFRFRYPFSSSWVVQSPEVAEQLEKNGRARMGDSPKPPDAKPEKHYYLLTLVRNLPGQGPNGRSRAIVQLVAEDVSAHPELTSGKECVLKLVEDLKRLHYTAAGEPKEVKISGQTFFRQDLKGVNSSGAPVFQSALFTVVQAHALGFILVAPTQLVLTNTLNTVDKVEFY